MRGSKYELDGKEPGPVLPEDIVQATRDLYIECRNKLVEIGQPIT